MAKQTKQRAQPTATKNKAPRVRDFPAVVVRETSEAFDAVRVIGALLASQDTEESVVGDDDMQWVGSFLRDVANAGEKKWEQELNDLRGKR